MTSSLQTFEGSASNFPVSIKASLKAGFGFLGQVDGNMLKILGMFFGIVFSLGVLGASIPLDYMPVPQGDELEIVTHPWVDLLCALATLPLLVYALQRVLFGQAPCAYFPYFVQGRLWRLVGGYLGAYLLSAIPALIVAIPLFGELQTMLAYFEGQGLSETSSYALIVVMFVVAAVPSIYLMMRFTLILPHTVALNRVEFKRAFALSKGFVWKILVVSVVSFLPFSIMAILLAAFGLVDIAGGFPGDVDVVVETGIRATWVGQNVWARGFIHAACGTLLTYLELSLMAALAHFYKSVLSARGESLT